MTFLVQVISNVLEPVLQNCAVNGESSVSQENFLVEFKRVAESVALHLREQPVIVAHSESTFDGSGIKRLLSNKYELDKVSCSCLSFLYEIQAIDNQSSRIKQLYNCNFCS